MALPSSGVNADNSPICDALLSLVVGSGETSDVDRSRFGPVVDQLGDDLPPDLRDDLTYLRELFRPFESDPALTWDDFVRGVDAGSRSNAVAATRRVNQWMTENCGQ